MPTFFLFIFIYLKLYPIPYNQFKHELARERHYISQVFGLKLIEWYWAFLWIECTWGDLVMMYCKVCSSEYIYIYVSWVWKCRLVVGCLARKLLAVLLIKNEIFYLVLWTVVSHVLSLIWCGNGHCLIGQVDGTGFLHEEETSSVEECWEVQEEINLKGFGPVVFGL